MPERLSYPTGDTQFGQEVQLTRSLQPIPVEGGGKPLVTADFLWKASANGWVFTAADADQNDTVTGQTSFADTTPTFCHDVPSGSVVIPLGLSLSQTGSVAGAAIDVIVEYDRVKRYSTGGTSEKCFNTFFNTARSSFYSGATAFTGYGITDLRATIGQDVSPAEGAVQGPFWRPDAPIILRGPASLLVYTYAGTTGPTWFWKYQFIEMTTTQFEEAFGNFLVR